MPLGNFKVTAEKHFLNLFLVFVHGMVHRDDTPRILNPAKHTYPLIYHT